MSLKTKKGGFKMTQCNVGFIIEDLASKPRIIAQKVMEDISSIFITGEIDVFFSGDHQEMMTRDPYVADFFSASGYIVTDVLIWLYL